MKRETISGIVKASGVLPGEIVLVHFWGDDTDKQIANDFVTAVAEAGATPVLLQQSRAINRAIFEAARETCFDDRYFELFSGFDAVLDVFAYQPVVLGSRIEDAQMALYRRYVSKLFYKLMKCGRFAQIRIPTAANAEESGLDPEDYIERMNRAYDIDYAALKSACVREKERFSGAARVVLRTGGDCALTFDLAGRMWHIDAGDGDMPCGEIYIAPVEDRTNGSVYFDAVRIDGVKYEGVTLHIVNGEIAGSSHPEVAGHFAALPKAERIVCELGLGMNPNVTDLCGYTLLDEKTAGTFHIAVGANDMFGGSNKASVHVDFVGYGETEVIS